MPASFDRRASRNRTPKGININSLQFNTQPNPEGVECPRQQKVRPIRHIVNQEEHPGIPTFRGEYHDLLPEQSITFATRYLQ